MAPKINLMNKFLTIVAGLLVQDHEIQKIDFQQLPFHRLFIMLFHDLTVNDPVCDQILPQVKMIEYEIEMLFYKVCTLI